MENKSFHLFSKKNILQLIFILIFVLFTRILILYPSIMLGDIINFIGENKLEIVNSKLKLLIIIAFFSMILIPLVNFNIAIFVQNIIKNFSSYIIEKLFNKQYELFIKLSAGELSSKIERGIFSFEKFLGFSLHNISPSIITILLITLYFLYKTNIYMTIFLILSAFIFIFISILLIKIRRPFINSINDCEDSIADFSINTIHSAKSIKSYGKNYFISSLFSNLFTSYAQRATKLNFISSIINSFQEMISLISSICIIWIGLFLLKQNNNFSSGDFIIIFSYSGIFMNNIKNIMNIYKEYKELKIDQYELTKILSFPIYRSNIQHFNFDSSVNIEINFSSDNLIPERKNILSLSHLHIKSNDCLLIKGKTGVGKTTLLEILAGITQNPQVVYLNNIDLHIFPASLINNLVFYLPQSPQFLSGKLKDCLLFGDNKEFLNKKDFIISLMTELLLNKFIKFIKEDKPIPINTMSGGEKKRFALIRGLISNAKIIILDEPTSELDSITKNVVWNIIIKYTKDKILICGTHDNKLSFSHKSILLS